MPRYFFHLKFGLKVFGARDPEGQELPNDGAARREAKIVASELSRNKHVMADERLVVINADGAVIHEESLLGRYGVGRSNS